MSVDIDSRQKKMGQSIQFTDKLGIEFFAPIGENEMKSQTLKIRNLKTREDKQIAFDQLKGFFN